MEPSTHPSSSRAPALLVAALILCAAGPARADDEVATYRAAVADGERRFHAEDFAGARAAFERAYAIHPEALLLFNIASTFRREGEDALAVQHYQRFLEEARAGDPRRALAVRTIAELEARIAAREPEPEPEPEPAPDAEPDPDPAPDPASEHDHEHDHEHERAGRSSGAVLRWAGVATGAGALGAFALSYLAARDARDAEDDLERLAPAEGWDRAQSDLYARGVAASRRALLWGVAGGALAATGIVLFAVGLQQGADRDDDDGGASLALTPTPGGAALTLTARY